MIILKYTMISIGAMVIAHFTVMPPVYRFFKSLFKKPVGVNGDGFVSAEANNENPNIDDYPLNDRKYRIETPEELLADFKPALRYIQNALGMTDERWEEIAYPTVKNFAGFVQKVPASENNHHRFAKGLLAHSIEVGRHALIQYQQENFLNDYSKEKRKFMEQRWALAVFYAALLHDIAKVVTDIVITDTDENHRWNGIQEDIYQWADRLNIKHYVFTYDKERKYENHELVNNIVTSRIISQKSYAYLAEEGPEIITAMLFSLTGQTNTGRIKADKLIGVVKGADSKSVKQDKERYVSPSEKKNQTLAPIDRLIDVFAELLRNNTEDTTWGVNQPGSGFYLSEKGLYAVWESKKVASLKEYAKEHVVNEDLVKLPDIVVEGMLNEAGVFYEKQGRNRWDSKVQIDDWATRLNMSLIIHPELIRAAYEKFYKQGFGFTSVTVKDSFADFTRFPYVLADYDPKKSEKEPINEVKDFVDDEQTQLEAVSEKDSSAEVDNIGKENEVLDESPKVKDKADANEEISETVEQGNSEEKVIEQESKQKEPVVESAKSDVKKEDSADSTSIRKVKTPKLLNKKAVSSNSETSSKSSVQPIKLPKAPRALRNRKNDKPATDRDILKSAQPSSDNASSKTKNDAGSVKQELPRNSSLTTTEVSVKDRIDPNKNSAFKRLQEQGQSGPILTTIGVSLLLESINKDAYFTDEKGYGILVWPACFKEQGREPDSLKDLMILESAVLPVDEEKKSFIHELKDKKGNIVSALILSPVFGKMFNEAFFETPKQAAVKIETAPRKPRALSQSNKKPQPKDAVKKTVTPENKTPLTIDVLDNILSSQIIQLNKENGWFSKSSDDFVMIRTASVLLIKKDKLNHVCQKLKTDIALKSLNDGIKHLSQFSEKHDAYYFSLKELAKTQKVLNGDPR